MTASAVLVTLAGWLLLGALVVGCADERPCPAGGVGEPGAPAPRRAITTPEGVIVHYPTWLDAHPGDRDAMLDELRDTAPEADPRIAPGARGVPAGATVVVLDPGPYHAPYSPTLLASGEWRAPSTIYVAWRGSPTGPRLPALAHELRHLLTGDARAGH